MPDRLRLLKKNVDENLYGNVRGSAVVSELTWGDDPDAKLISPLPDYGNNPNIFSSLPLTYVVIHFFNL